MLAEKNVQQILEQIVSGEIITIPFEGIDIHVRTIDDSSKLSLTALVYDGGGYIPSSVRACLANKVPFFKSDILTFLTVDEAYFQVNINYLGRVHLNDSIEIRDLLESFGIITEKWRYYLEEHGKKDLVYVNAR